MEEIGDNEEYDRSIAVFYNFKGEDITDEYLSKMVKACEKTYNFFIVAPALNKKNTITVLDRKASAFIKEL